MANDEGAFLIRDGADGPYCPVRYVWLERSNRGRRSWAPLVVPDVPEINEPVFGTLAWLGIIPLSFFGAPEKRNDARPAGNEP